MDTETSHNVPNDRVEQVKADCRAAGAFNVSVTPDGEGTSTVVCFFADDPSDASAAHASAAAAHTSAANAHAMTAKLLTAKA